MLGLKLQDKILSSGIRKRTKITDIIEYRQGFSPGTPVSSPSFIGLMVQPKTKNKSKTNKQKKLK